jgi:sec-independent protein translocase protein TatA
MFRNPTTDLIVVLVIVLLIFGPKRLPGLGKQLGTGLREFKESITGENKDEDEAARPEITAATNASTPDGPASAAPAERQSAEVGPQSRS